MYVTSKMLAELYECSVKTIDRNVLKMERSGLFPNAVIKLGVKKICLEDFERFIKAERRKKWEK